MRSNRTMMFAGILGASSLALSAAAALAGPAEDPVPGSARNRPSGSKPVSGGGARERARRIAYMQKHGFPAGEGDPKIVTTYVYPPIPWRHMDWQATYDGDEPDDDGTAMRHGSGSGETEIEAIDNLQENAPYYAEENCPGHYASRRDPKICGGCGIHVDSLK